MTHLVGSPGKSCPASSVPFITCCRHPSYHGYDFYYRIRCQFQRCNGRPLFGVGVVTGVVTVFAFGLYPGGAYFSSRYFARWGYYWVTSLAPVEFRWVDRDW